MSLAVNNIPVIFQAGMGAWVSGSYMAREVSRLGGLGIVSSVGLRTIVVEAVRKGNQEMIEAAKNFPFSSYIEEMLAFMPGQRSHGEAVPVDRLGPEGGLAQRLSTIAAFIEVSLAKKGHSGKIGINVMWKLSMTVLPVIYGSMLAGVDAIVCGAGVPMDVPGIMNNLHTGENIDSPALYGTKTPVSLSVEEGTAELLASRNRPLLIPILSNYVFCRKIRDNWEKNFGIEPDFFVLEDYKAGGHNAPPRDKMTHSPKKDGIETYFDQVAELGIPIVVAGAFEHGGTREDLLYWQKKGAYGIQVGSRFALCRESGILQKYRQEIIQANQNGGVEVLTCYQDSPTGYPIHRASLTGTLSDPVVYGARKRMCEHGYLCQCHSYTDKADKDVSMLICPAMPLSQYSGLCPDKTPEQCAADCEGKICLCEGLLATVGVLTTPPAYITLGESGRLFKKEESAREILEEIMTPEYVADQENCLLVG